MVESAWKLVAAGAAGLVIAAGAALAQQVTIGPLTATGAPGQEIDFNITYNGPLNTNGIAFNILYPASAGAAYSPVFKGASTTRITCSTAADLEPNIDTAAVLFNGGTEIGFTVIGANIEGVFAFGRTGIVGSCKFKIAATASGTVPLPCDMTATGRANASDVQGHDLSAACVDGMLTIASPVTPTNTPTVTDTPTVIQTPSNTPTLTPHTCIGDRNGDMEIDADEIELTINAFAQDDVSLNPAADGNGNGSVEANEVVQVILNFAIGECNPYHA